MSLVWLSLVDPGAMCRPEISPMGDDEPVFMDIEQMRHPCLCKAGV